MAEAAFTGPKSLIPAIARIYQPIAPMAYAFLRVCFGAIMIPHGIQNLNYGFATKFLTVWGLPAPGLWTWGVGLIETVGGGMLILGLLTRPVALLLMIELLVILFGVHLGNGWSWTAKGGGVQYPILLLALNWAVLWRGGGRYSLDRLIGKEF